jgi:hypothetical protein
MRESLYKILGGLASKAYQEEYIVRGNANQYVLPEELLEDAETVVSRALGKPNEFQLSEFEIEALTALHISLKQNSEQIDFGSSKHDLIQKNPYWSSIRTQAIECFKTLKFQLETWENENIIEGA